MTADLNPALVNAALKAGMHDPDDLRILTPAQLDRDPVAVIADLKAQRPALFVKQAKDLSPLEREAVLADLKRNPPKAQPRTAPPARVAEPAEPPAQKRTAVQMLLEEMAEFLRQHAKHLSDDMQLYSIHRKSQFAN